MGRPAKPIEHHRRVGRGGYAKANGTPLRELATVSTLRMADGVPDAPDGLGIEAQQLWSRAWGAAVTWLSPDTDRDAIELACRLKNGAIVAQRRFLATSEPADARAWATLEDHLGKALSRLGFDPTARSTLGVAEVRAQSELEKIRTNQAKRATR